MDEGREKLYRSKSCKSFFKTLNNNKYLMFATSDRYFCSFRLTDYILTQIESELIFLILCLILYEDY